MRRNGRRGPAVVSALAALALAAACHPAKAAPVLAPGAHGPAVRDLQARLAQLGLFRRNPTGRYATETATAVRTFQHQAGLPTTGTYTTADRTALTSRTRKPHHSALFPDRSDN
ncbi:peptidoglycan-binding domain-containing protein [Streptomyces sp. NPDC039016]|uniref:peptidoglycan-binding domain-containing protein n=1 Tax=unclassified Streptomyces TaxID=2593676 RepID=UPI0033D382E8